MARPSKDSVQRAELSIDLVVDVDAIVRLTQLHEAVKNAPDTMTFNEGEAAFYLGCSPRTLEGWRSKKLPPPTWAPKVGGKSVRYRVVDLQAFIRGTEKLRGATETVGLKNGAPMLKGSSVGLNAQAVNRAAAKRARCHSAIAWRDANLTLSEDTFEAFFVDDAGLVVAHGWEESTPIIAERLMAQSPTIQWMSWDTAIAGVWVHEERRLAWLAHLENGEPGFESRVAKIRSDVLAKI